MKIFIDFQEVRSPVPLKRTVTELLKRGHIPFSHQLLFNHVQKDGTDKENNQLINEAVEAWLDCCDAVLILENNPSLMTKARRKHKEIFTALADVPSLRFYPVFTSDDQLKT